MKVLLAQINPTVGDIEGNSLKIVEAIKKGKQQKVDLVILPELVLTGYPPRDLLIKKSFVEKNKTELKKIISETEGIAVIFGFVDEVKGDLYNAAAFIHNNSLKGIYHKIHLPNYDIFDEKRYFKPGKAADVFEFRGKKLGLTICEDIWVDNGPMSKLKDGGAELIINISGSPFYANKSQERENLLRKRSMEHKLPIIYLNLVGGQDDLLFDGRSYVFNSKGEPVIIAKPFEEDYAIVDINNIELMDKASITETVTEDTYNGLVLGVRDYFRKNGFSKAVIGLSGGIDSALTVCIAVEALGKENVIGVSMPSKFSSVGSVEDSKILAENLQIKFNILPINEIYTNYLLTLENDFSGREFNVAEENVQARIRGNLLMALSNKFGYLVLATGNKSELSVGYATLYGDMAGGLAVISDVLKTRVYELSKYVNQKAGQEIIPQVIILKEPSAELRDNQKDSDSLPPYDILDGILKAYVELDYSKEEIISLGFDPEVVDKVIKMVDRNEYKRQQAAIGIKITPRAFGTGRRMPITNGWKE